MLPRSRQPFFRIYETSAAICNAVNDVRNIRQQPREDDLTYGGRINDAVHSCENVSDELDKMAIFVSERLTSI